MFPSTLSDISNLAAPRGTIVSIGARAGLPCLYAPASEATTIGYDCDAEEEFQE